MNFTPNDNFIYYLSFIQERMNIFWNKLNGVEPLTEDKIFQEFKFTNVYRVLDRASQYLLSNVIYNGHAYTDEEMFWRILIYKHFNLPHTWDLLIEEFGDVDRNVTLSDISDLLDKKAAEGHIIYSNAYMMTSAFLVGEKGEYTALKNNKWRKHRYYFFIFQKEIIERGGLKKIMASRDFEELFNNIKSITSMGDFIAYQYAQDLVYSDLFDFSLNDFCAAGPGTQRGIERTFDIKGKANYQEIVKWTHQNYHNLVEVFNKKFDVDLTAKLIPGLPMMVPDFSNCFCETSKYMKGISPTDKTGDKRIKQLYKPSVGGISFYFPSKWGNVSLK